MASDPKKVSAVTDALHTEATKWREMSGQVAAIKTAASGLNLQVTAFFVPMDFTGPLDWNMYNNIQARMADLYGQAETEFSQIGTVFDRIAESMKTTDEDDYVDLNKIYHI
jgi:hypothetical protein